MKLTSFGPDVFMDEKNYALSFEEGLVPKSSSSKYFGQVKNLAYDPGGTGDDELCYTFYQDLMREKDKAFFERYSYTNGITVLMPGLVGGECRKNSGHYHDYVKGHTKTLTEVYEVIAGKAAFLLQESHNFDSEEELKVESMTVVLASEGDKVIVPPFCAHCISNIGDGPMLFGNLAAPCPLRYDPIQKKHGFGVYILKNSDGSLKYVPNPHYKALPELRISYAQEDPDLGLIRTRSLYDSFLEEPEKLEFLYEPEKYENRVWELIRKGEQE